MRYATITLTCVVLTATACGGALGPMAIENPAALDPEAPSWALRADVIPRAHETAELSAAAWGGTPADLDGVTIRIVGADIDCSGVDALGCTVGDAVEATALYSGCPEDTALPHEMGHVVIGDYEHRDPRWRSDAFWAALQAQLAAGVPDDDPICALNLAVPNGEALH